MPRRRKNKRSFFEESAALNNAYYNQYSKRLCELSISMFKYENLPESVDPRYLEMTLFETGQAVFFEDEVMGYLALKCTLSGQFDVYRVPIGRMAYADNGYTRQLSNKDSVIIYNNYLRTNSVDDVLLFARRLYNLDRIIDVNANAQKTPILISCDEDMRLTMLNLFKEFDGNAPVIFGDKRITPGALQVLSTEAPYVGDKLTQLKTNIWNEALTYLGIPNLTVNKKERLITDEVMRSQGGVMASRQSRLQARIEAVDKINDMFDLDIKVSFRDDMSIDEDMPDVGEDEEGLEDE